MKYLLEEKNIGLLEVGKDKYSDDIIVHVSIPAKYNRLATEWKKRGLKSTRDYCETYYSNPKPSLNSTLQAKWNSDWCESKVINRKRYFRIRKEQYYGV